MSDYVDCSGSSTASCFLHNSHTAPDTHSEKTAPKTMQGVAAHSWRCSCILSVASTHTWAIENANDDGGTTIVSYFASTSQSFLGLAPAIY